MSKEKYKIFIIHGAYGNPKNNWIPWLKQKLETEGYFVEVPKFPTPENQNITAWRDVWADYESKLNKDSVVIGHSIGATFSLDIVERAYTKIKGLVLISGFLQALDNKTFDKINATFYQDSFDFKIIRNNCQNISILHGDNDPYVPISEAKNLGKLLKTNPIIIKNAGHFNVDAGYTKFPELLNIINNF